LYGVSTAPHCSIMSSVTYRLQHWENAMCSKSNRWYRLYFRRSKIKGKVAFKSFAVSSHQVRNESYSDVPLMFYALNVWSKAPTQSAGHCNETRRQYLFETHSATKSRTKASAKSGRKILVYRSAVLVRLRRLDSQLCVITRVLVLLQKRKMHSDSRKQTREGFKLYTQRPTWLVKGNSTLI
jgi:hypothetical protein